MKVAIVGTGISGLVVARQLFGRHDLTIFEADRRIGGHSHTVDVDVDGEHVSVDTGFIVFNDRNYPAFSALLRDLGVATQPSDMSFSVSDPATGVEYSSAGLTGIFAQRANLLKPRFYRLLWEIARFNRAVQRAARSGVDDDVSLADFVRRNHFSDGFVQRFLVPFGASLWSADPTTLLQFPFQTYARFTKNHGMLELTGRPRWRTVTGGARNYLIPMTAPFLHRIRLDEAVHKISNEHGLEVVTTSGVEHFDRVVLACHSDQALRLLATATSEQRRILGPLRYQRNHLTLHTDARMLPRSRNARASWNYRVANGTRHATVTYWMNRLQSIATRRPLLLTLNQPDAIDDNAVLREFEYEHPVFDVAALHAQKHQHVIQGVGGVYFAGAYWGYGFHEDGVQSGLAVARALDTGR